MIKECPVCGKLSVRFYKGYSKKEKIACANPDCPIKEIRMDYRKWQDRPRDKEFEQKIKYLEFLLESKKDVHCSKDGDLPTAKKYNDIGTMILFQIEGETYIGGYIPKTKTWFDQDGETFRNEDYIVYWRHLENLEFKYNFQKEIENECNNSN